MMVTVSDTLRGLKKKVRNWEKVEKEKLLLDFKQTNEMISDILKEIDDGAIVS